MKENNKKIITISSISLLIVLLVSATYAFFMYQIDDEEIANVDIESASVDLLTFNKSGDLNLTVTKDNLVENGDDLSSSLTLTAHLKANNYNNKAFFKYNIYLEINKNEFIYTQDESTPELILKIIDPTTGSTGKNFSETLTPDLVSNSSADGDYYDLTNKTGVFTVVDDYIIEANDETGGDVTHDWIFEITFLNLDANQYKNAEKEFAANVIIQGEKLNVYDNSLASTTYRSNQYKSKIKNIYFVDYIAENLESKVDNWDLSLSQNGSIMGWLENNNIDENKPYNLYIGSNSPIIIPSFDKAFYEMSAEYIDLSTNLDTSIMKSTSNMFSWDASLKEIKGLDTLDMSSVTDISSMFYWCGINELDLSNWDVSNVTNMSSMFYTSLLTTIGDIGKWDVSNVENMSMMFLDSMDLTTIGDLSNWDVSNVTDMSSMFSNARSLASIGDISSWDVSNVKNMSGMFGYTSSQMAIGDISNWNTSNVTNMSGMFNESSIPDNIILSNWNTSNVTDMSKMFKGSSLNSNTIENLNTSSVTNMSEMFSNSSTPDLNLSKWDVSNVTNMYGMFSNSYIDTLNLSNWKTSNVTSMSNMFAYASIASLDSISNWDVSNVTNMSNMFRGASNLTELKLNGWDTSNVTNMNSMFGMYDAKNNPISNQLLNVYMNNANFNKVKDYNYMFYNLDSGFNITVNKEAGDWLLSKTTLYYNQITSI